MRRRAKRFFWRWSAGRYVYTGLYVWRGWFFGFVRLAGRDGHAILNDILKAANPR